MDEYLEPTTLLYMEDTYLFEGEAVITAVSTEPNEKGLFSVYLDQTIFHPQGGGQPADTGTITCIEDNDISLQVIDTRATGDERNKIIHFGKYEREDSKHLSIGDKVSIIINKENRIKYAQCHSAGHLLDVAIIRFLKEEEEIGFKYDLVPGKGYHFLSGPYVEYKGIIPIERRTHAKEKIEKEINKLIHESIDVDVTIVSSDISFKEEEREKEEREKEEGKKEEGKKEEKDINPIVEEVKRLCGGTFPSYLPRDKPIRVVTVAGDIGCPCGGTHVKNTSEMGHVIIRKITCRKGNTRISYNIS